MNRWVKNTPSKKFLEKIEFPTPFLFKIEKPLSDLCCKKIRIKNTENQSQQKYLELRQKKHGNILQRYRDSADRLLVDTCVTIARGHIHARHF